MIRRSLLASSCCVALALGACRDAPPPPEPDAAAEVAPSSPPTDRADPGPLLTRELGAGRVIEHPSVTLEVDAVETIGGAVYLRALVPIDPEDVIMGDAAAARLEVLGPRHGFAVPAAEGRMADRPWLYVRLVGDEPPPDPLVVRWRQPALLDGEPGQTQEMRLVGAATATPFPRLAPRVFEAMARWFTHHRGLAEPTPFAAFAAGRLTRLARPERARRARQVELPDLLGPDPASFEPGLMFDRGLGLGPGDAEPAPGAPKPAAPVGYPWAAVMAERPPATPDPLAAWAPAEWIYARVSDLAAGLEALDGLEALAGPPLAALTAASGSRHRLERLLRQLGLDRATLEALAPHTGAAAVLLSDPMVHAGPGLALVIEVEAPGPVDAALKARDDAARAAGAGGGPIEVRGRAGDRLMTPDRAVHAHRVRTDGVLIVTNGPAVLDRVLAARDGDRPLAASDDLKALRGRLPAGADEVAFVAVGEAHLEQLVEPTQRILAARRARALADLRAVDFAALLFGWLEGRPLDLARPDDRAALRASGLLIDGDLRHDDGGPISLDLGGRPCSRWGCAGIGRPLIELSLDGITAAEAGAWDRLRADRLQRWRAHVAPLAAQIRRADGGFDLEAHLLPLDRQHAYLDLQRLIGGLTVGPAPSTPGLEVQVALAPDGPLRAKLDGWLAEQTAQRDVGLSWLGPRVTVGFAERSGLWDAVLTFAELPDRRGRRIWRDAERRKRILDRLPLYALLPVVDRPALDRALTAARVFAAAEGVVQWRPAAPYRGVETHEVREVLSESPESRVGLFFAVAGDTLVLALDRPVFEATVDRALDGEAASGSKARAGARLSLRFGSAGWLRRAVAGLLERFAPGRLARARGTFEAAARGRRLPAPGPARDAALIEALGVVPTGPHGDRVGVDADGQPTLPRYGTALEPRWPTLPVAGGLLETLRALDLGLRFEGEPGRSALVVELSWRR